MASETVYWGQRALAEISSVGTGLANVSGAVGQTSLNVTGNIYSSNSVTTGNLITNNIIMSSNMSSGTGLGNVYFSGNLVVTGNIFSSGGSVGSGSGTSQGILFSLGSGGYTLPSAFSTGTAGPGISGYHVNLSSFAQEAAQAVTQFGAGTGLLKFLTAGLYQVTCVIVGDQPVAKVAIGKTASLTSWTALQASGQGATTGYDYVYNYPVGSSPSEIVTLPLTVTDITQYYYLDVFFSTAVAAPTVLYPTRSTTAAGSNFGTYVQVAPFGNYLTSATGVASALLANCVGSSNLSGVYSSNAYRITLTSANGWTVNGVSTSLAVTANGNFQVNQTGIYEVNLCLNTVDQTACQFRVGSLASDTLAPGGTTPAYLYSYSPMYTQDPTTAIQLPLNITNISNIYFVECSFPGTLTGNVALSNVSTFVSIKPIGGYISTGTDPWIQQGTSVYYNGGPVGIGGVIPTSLTETLTVNGNTSFVGNVTVTSDASSNNYVLARRVPAGSLSVSNYVTGSVPLTTTTSLINNYLSNAAAIVANTSTGTITQALSLPGTTTSGLIIPNGGSSVSLASGSANLYFECWINPGATTGGNRSVFARANATPAWDISFILSSTGAPSLTVWNTSGTLSSPNASNATTLSSGTWYHLAFSYVASTGVTRVFTNGGLGGTTGSLTGTLRATALSNIYIGYDASGSVLAANIADVRVWSGGIVPTATFASPAAAPFGSTQPAYITGTPTLLMSLNSQYFPGASTSPYGPCLTLPGTVGSYYSQSTTALNTALNSGFTIEAWVNYASLANSNLYYSSTSLSFMLGKINPVASGSGGDWYFGPTTTGQVCLEYYNGGGSYGLITSGTITTGLWSHLVVQGNTAGYVNMFINGQIQTLTAQNYAGSGTAVALNGTVTTNQYNGITVGQYYGNQGPNFAIAKARVLFGANTYTTSTFTPSPNFASVPAGATIAWQLDSQFPLPTYPSIQDVTVVPSQLTSYGSIPTPVGGVTSNVAGPYGSSPQLGSVRFDGTGYIDYGNAASSALTTNIWASNWTIEAWVYLPSTLGAGQSPGILSRSSPSGSSTLVDWTLYLGNNPANLLFAYGSGGLVYNYNASTTIPTGTWTHVAATYDGTRSNVYVNGALSNSMVATTTAMSFNPTYGTVAGGYNYGLYLASENLADLRVSNVARYTGSSYTVPSAPFATDSSTLLLLRSLAGQTGTTLQVQGRGLNSTSIGAGRVVQSYPPAPMSSYLLDTTSNSSVTYGQGKYVASASTELQGYGGNYAYYAFDKSTATGYAPGPGFNYYPVYSGSVTTVDSLGTSYSGDWLQLQMPVSVLMSSYSITGNPSPNQVQVPVKWWVLGSRDGTNWTVVDSRNTTVLTTGAPQTFSVGATQAYNYYRMVVNQVGGGGIWVIIEWTLNGTEESLCVTSDSKVGVGIANPQRALEVAGDLVVSGTISGGAGLGGFRNRIINGDMRIAQRGTSNVLAATGSDVKNYMIDRFYAQSSFSTASGITQYQSALAASDAPYQLGLRNYMNVFVNIGSSVTALLPISQVLEGYNIQDLNWGTSFGSPVTLSFWFRSNAPAGSQFTYSLLCFTPGTPSWAGTFVPIPGVWQYWTFTVPPPPNGSSWSTGSTGALAVYVAPYYPGGFTTTVNAWNSGSFTYCAYGSYNWPGLAGNFIHCTGVQLEKGTVATPWEQRPYATELALCQRYYQKSYDDGVVPGAVTGTGALQAYFTSTGGGSFSCNFPVKMRADPVVVAYSSSSGTAGKMYSPGPAADFAVSVDKQSQQVLTIYANATLTVPNYYYVQWTANAEL